MSDKSEEANLQLRWGVYALLIMISVGSMTGRLLAVNSVNRIDLERHLINRDLEQVEQRLKAQDLPEEEYQERLQEARERIESERRLQRPFLSANDRSRWLAIRALVEEGTYAIDGLLDRHVWNTIDMVQHRGRDGELHLYSSKPPLLITLLAGEYWLIHKVTGVTLETHPYFVGRLMLFTVHILPMALMFFLIAKLAERFGTSDWGKIFVIACACFGTMLTTFAVVLNNHIIGAVSAAIAICAFVRIWCDGDIRLRHFVVCGLAAAFTAANELPALSLFALMALALLLRHRKEFALGFLPTAAVVALATFGTNYAAHGTLSPPYMHKSTADPEDNWYHYTYTVDGREIQSYWQDRQGIDIGEPSRLIYAWHVLVGHHGILSLTPIWLLSIYGTLLWIKQEKPDLRALALGTALLTIVCLVFFIGLRPQEDRNYGGMTSGFRWMFWFAPLWLVTMLPAADRVAKLRWARMLALVMLAISALSASYPTWNPWTHPWIYRAMEASGML